MEVSLHLPSVLSRVSYRCPFILVDTVTEPEQVTGSWPTNITVSEEFFQGRTFRSAPILPAVLMIEARSQLARLSSAARGVADRTRGAQRRQQREVPPSGGAEIAFGSK